MKLDLPAEAIPVSEVLARCASARQATIRYKLGTGGRHPEANSPADSAGCCDCSGFSAWAIRRDRKTSDGHWTNTDSIEQDARKPGGIYERILLPRVGCTIVYGAGPRIGHVGIVTQVLATPAAMAKMARWQVLADAIRVTHCSSKNGQRTPGRAVQETDGLKFGGDRDDMCFAHYVGMQP